jgi:FMN phosphatase YigB (HAD superfamily)
MKLIEAIYFDLGGTLGTAVIGPDGKLQAFNPFEFSAAVLQRLSDRQLQLGVISNTGNETGARVNELLTSAGLLKFFGPKLLIYSSEVHLTKDSPAIFRLAAKRAGLKDTPSRCMFVGEDVGERNEALAAHLQVCDDPRNVEALLDAPTGG